MKQYRLKEEVKKYFEPILQNKVGPMDFWECTSMEALEEVPQRIELEHCRCKGTFHIKTSILGFIIEERDITQQELDLCEKALNGELLDIDSLDDEEFMKWYIREDACLNIDNGYQIEGLKAVLKEYLNQRNDKD